MQKIIPNIWYTGNAEDAGAYYASIFDDRPSSRAHPSWLTSRSAATTSP